MVMRRLLCSLVFGIAVSSASSVTASNIEMVSVKGGCFQMGDTFGDGVEDEKPVHKVCLKDFSIGKYEVTQAQWQEIMGSNPSASKGNAKPVETVSWNDVQQFLAKVRETAKVAYRLPTEAEWEYAARAGAAQEKWSGTNSEKDVHDFAWLEKTSQEQPHDVGTKKANAFGIFDMTGNVAEWCRDLYAETYYAESPGESPLGPKEGTSRVVRGGSWVDDDWSSRAIRRGARKPDAKTSYIGFRVAVSGN